jgi:hypothetical protein
MKIAKMTWYFNIEISDKTIRIYALDQKCQNQQQHQQTFRHQILIISPSKEAQNYHLLKWHVTIYQLCDNANHTER